MDFFKAAKLTREQIKNMSAWIAVLINGIVPGGLYLYFYQTELFISLETGKVIFLSIILSIPILVMNMVAIRFSESEGQKIKENFFWKVSVISLFFVLMWSFLAKIEPLSNLFPLLKGYSGLLMVLFVIMIGELVEGIIRKKKS